MCKFMIFCNLTEKKEKKLKKKLQNYPKMLIFGKIYTKFAGCHGNVKNDKHTTDISKFWQRS